jgi:hypothetical protein
MSAAGVNAMKTCPRCGVENKPEKAACWNCWSPLESPTGAVAQPKPTGRRVSLTVPWTAVVVVLLVFVCAAGAYFLLFRSKPADVAEQYLDAIRNGNDKKRDRLSTKETAGESPLPKMMIISQYSVQRDAVTTSGATADVPATVNFIVEPTLALAEPIRADVVTSHLQKQAVRASLVLVKERFMWRVDQKQTALKFTQALTRELPAGIAAQLMALAAAAKAMPAVLPTAPALGQTPRPPAAAPGVTPAAPAAPRPGLGAPAAGRPLPAPGAAKAARSKAPAATTEEEPEMKGGLRRTLPSDTGE